MITFRGRNGAMIADKGFAECIQVGGTYTGLYMRFQKFEGAGGKNRTLPDAFYLFRSLDPDGHVAKLNVLHGYCLKKE